MSNSTSATSLADVPATSSTQAPSVTSTSLSASSDATPTSTSSIANSSPTAVTSTEDPTTSTLETSIVSSAAPSTTPTTTDATTTAETPTTTTQGQQTTTTPTTTTPTSALVTTSVIVITPTTGDGTPQTTTEIITSTAAAATGTSASSKTTSSKTSSSSAVLISQGSSSGSSQGLSNSGKIAIAVVVPIIAVALIVVALLFLWRKRKQRKDAEELRRKEVEEYGYNPNNDPTLPAAGTGGSDGPFEMREDGSSGYRGWGATAVASSGRKASTTLSGGGIGQAYSGDTSPTHGPGSETRSGDALMGNDGRPLSEADDIGAMGPAASGNRQQGDINRGPSNASSSYSTANRSDGSGEGAVPGGAYGQAQYYSNDQYNEGNPYNDSQYGSPPGRAEMSGQPVIRDVSARRNTRIENPSHFPQQSAGISQNF